MKRKIRPTHLVILVILINLTILTVLIVHLALSVRATEKSGFDEWDPESSTLVNDFFLEKDFLTRYPYQDGDFRRYCKKKFFFSLWGGIPHFGVGPTAERSFVWLTYDDAETYRDAKQSRFGQRQRQEVSDSSLDGTVAFGYTFYINNDFFANPLGSQYPYHFTAFGYNDDTQTLVFLGFLGSGKKQTAYVDLAKTDFSAFLSHYYGDWYDWE